MTTARQAAAQALTRCERGGYSQLVLNGAIRQAALTPRDAAFATALFYGALERKLTLDHCIARYARHPLSEEIASVLRVALYQLLYLDAVPPRAAVDEAVEATRRMRQGAAAGMVNGILRSFLRDGCRIPPVAGTLAGLRVQYSCGEAVIERLIDWYGQEKAEEILSSSMGRAPLYLRINPLRTDAAALIQALAAEGVTAVSGPIEGSLRADSDAARTKAHQKGLFHIQDVSSQRAARTMGACAGDRVLDVCAAPGSKSFTMAEQMENTGSILSCDVSAPRLKLIAEGAKRLGVRILETRQNDGTVFDASLGEFDRVLCDVPCSGLGVMRRKPELKYRDAASFAGLPAIQYKILATSSQYCKVNGVLVYSTCTINPAENEQVIDRFLAEYPAFEPDLPDGARGETCLPNPTGGDGFFIARVRRRRG